MKRVFNKVETLNPAEIEEFQFKLLKKQLEYVYTRSKFYRRKFDSEGIKPYAIRKWGDFQNIPFTTKQELRDYNSEFICASNGNIVDIGTTTGTSGVPVILPATKNDWHNLIRSLVTACKIVGITRKDIVQLCLAFDQLFSVSIPIDDALKTIGATSVRMGPGNLARQLEMMQRLKTNVIFATPDFMFMLAEKAREMGKEPSEDFSLEKGAFIGQPLWKRGWEPTETKKNLEDLWGIESFSGYGSMEIFTGFYECLEHRGHHTYPDYHYFEIIDPMTGETLSPREEGELVVTHLKLEGIPLIRYRQGDITSIESDVCSCGRTSPRIMAILGRADGMLKIKGTSVYPQQIEDSLWNIQGIERYFIEAFSDMHSSDRVAIKVCTTSNQETMKEKIVEQVKYRTRITPEVEFVSKSELDAIIYQNGTRKPNLFLDHRKKN